MTKMKGKFCRCLWWTAYHDKKCRFNCANKLIRLEKRRPMSFKEWVDGKNGIL